MKNDSYLRKYGYTLKEIGAHMGISPQRVLMLARIDSPRIAQAVKEMKAKRKAS